MEILVEMDVRKWTQYIDNATGVTNKQEIELTNEKIQLSDAFLIQWRPKTRVTRNPTQSEPRNISRPLFFTLEASPASCTAIPTRTSRGICFFHYKRSRLYTGFNISRAPALEREVIFPSADWSPAPYEPCLPRGSERDACVRAAGSVHGVERDGRTCWILEVLESVVSIIRARMK